MAVARLITLRYFYPRPPRGGRLKGHGAEWVTKIFLSTPSARRATAYGGHKNFSG